MRTQTRPTLRKWKQQWSTTENQMSRATTDQWERQVQGGEAGGRTVTGGQASREGWRSGGREVEGGSGSPKVSGQASWSLSWESRAREDAVEIHAVRWVTIAVPC